MIWEHCLDSTIIILSIAAVVSLALGLAFPEQFFNPDCMCIDTDSTAWVEGVAILVAVIVIVMVGSLQDYDKELKFRALGKEDKRFIKVVRGGSPLEVRTNEVVVGDIVLLEWGKFIPADGYLISGDSLKVDESSVSGEAEPVGKSANDPWLMTNCSVTQGSGRMLVGAVGEHTEWGRTLQNLQESDFEETPLQQDLGEIVIGISKFGAFFGTITFFVLAIYWAVDTGDLISVTAWSDTYIRGIVDALIIGITLLVVGIPEGLPLAVIISLAYSMKAMTKDNNLVRHLQSCETMGGATNICSDKTGTLTLNQMTVKEAWIGMQRAESVPWNASEVHLSPDFWHILRSGVALNATAMRQLDKDSGLPKVVGMPTEMSLMDMVDVVEGNKALVGYYDELRKQEAQNLVVQMPYNSANKYMTTIYYVPQLDVLRIFVKGAPEMLIHGCTHLQRGDGSLVECTEKDRDEMRAVVSRFAASAYRTLLVGFRDVPASLYLRNPEAPVAAKDSDAGRYYVDLKAEPLDRSIVIQGIFGIEDPVRPEVPLAVATCLDAGITVRMLTGDHPDTATKIAEQCGIKTSKGIVVLGEEFRTWSDEHVDRMLPQLQVMARCQPADKLRLVKRLRHLNQIVAVTGDGTNDAPALKEADVGLAMGIAGTDVAKEACDIIIMDDNFKSIVSSVKWGRNVYESVRKFLQFQLTVNLAALALVFIGAVSRYGAPLRAVQLLWVNLIMDTLAALALATEPPTDALLLQKPHGKTERIVNNIMWKHIVGHALFQLGSLLALLYAAHLIPWTTGTLPVQSTAHYTIVFNTFVWEQLFNELNARSIDDHQNIFSGLHKSYIFIGVLVVSAGLQAIIVEFGGAAFKCTGLSWDQWLFCIAIGALELPLGFLLRMIPVPERHFIDIMQFWNPHDPVRVSETKYVPIYGEDGDEMVEMVEAPLLPKEEALAEIERERLAAKERKAVEDKAKLEKWAKIHEEQKQEKAHEKEEQKAKAHEK